MGIHDEHRDRTLKKFSKYGFTGLEEHEKLEIILFFSVPRVDTNEIAHKLINKYHNIAGVMDAPADELITFEYITDRTVQLFKMIKETYTIYQIEKSSDKSYMTTTDEFGTYFQLFIGSEQEEKMAIMCLDSRGKVLKTEIIGEGDISAVTTNSRKLLEMVLHSKATEVVLAHNHPGNIPFPSRGDVAATETLKDLLAGVGVQLIDHFVVTAEEYCSMAKCKEYSRIFKR